MTGFNYIAIAFLPSWALPTLYLSAVGPGADRRGAPGLPHRGGRRRGAGEVVRVERGGEVTHDKLVKYKEKRKYEKTAQNQDLTCVLQCVFFYLQKPTMLPR